MPESKTTNIELIDLRECCRRDDTMKKQVLSIIKETMDAPTWIEPIANCKNLTKTLQRIEVLVKERTERAWDVNRN